MQTKRAVWLIVGAACFHAAAHGARDPEAPIVGPAIDLSFPDSAVESLATMLPDRNGRILIYCNNNFRGAEGPFPAKLASASLNLATYLALYDYGYRNLHELGALIDFDKTEIVFASAALRCAELPRRQRVATSPCAAASARS